MARSPRVRLLNRQRRLRVDPNEIRGLVERILDGEGADPRSTVEVVLLRDGPMAELNARYRDRSGPTDVLSFPTDDEGWPAEEPPLLGMVIVSVDRAWDQAAERGLAVEEETRRLVAHGALHLLGYGDTTSRERSRMRRREDHYLRPRTERR